MSTLAPNTDLDYIQKYQASKEAQQNLAFANYRGDNQYIWVYSRNAFIRGAYYGSFVGLLASVYHRRLRLIPGYAVGFGISYAAWAGSSAYFRNEL